MAGPFDSDVKIVLAKTGGRPALVRMMVGGHERCAVISYETNNRLAPGRAVPQLRFTCSGYCGIPVKRSSAHCKAVDTAPSQQLAAQNLVGPIQIVGTAPAGIPGESHLGAAPPAISGAGPGATGGFFALPAPGVP